MNELLKTKDGKYIYICSVSSDYTTNDSVLVGAEEIKYFPKQCVVFLATYQEDFEDFVDGGVANENILFAVKARSRKALKEKILSDTSLVASGSKSFQGILDLFAGNVFWPYIAENRVRLNPNPNGGAFLSPTWDIGIPLSGEWIWNGSSVVSVSGSVFQNGIKEIYKGGMIRLCNDGQVNPWFVIEKIVWNGNSATIMIRPEGRNPPSGVGGVTEIKNYGQGATLGECFGGGYPSIGSYNALVTPTWVVDYQGNPWKEEIDLVTRANMCKPWNRDVMIINDDTPVLSVEALGNLPDGDTERYFGGNICVNLNFPTFGGFAPDVSTGFPEANENLGALSDDTPYPVESSVVWPTGSVDGIASVLVNNPSEFVMGHVMNASTYVAEKTRPIEMIRMDQDTRDWTGRDISTPGYGWFSIVDVGRRDVESENLLFSETELDTHEAILSSSFGALPIADVDKSGVLEVIGGENEGLHDRWSGKWTFVRTPNGYTKIKLFIPFDVSSTYILRNFEVYTGEIKIKVDDRIVPTTTNESTYSRSIRGGMTYGIPHAKHVVYTDIFSFETGFDPLATWIAVAERVEEDGLDSYTAFFDAPSPITKDYDKIKKLYKSALEQFKKANCIVPAAMVNAFGQNHSSSSSLPKLLWSLADFNEDSDMVLGMYQSKDYDRESSNLERYKPDPGKEVQSREFNLVRPASSFYPGYIGSFLPPELNVPTSGWIPIWVSGYGEKTTIGTPIGGGDMFYSGSDPLGGNSLPQMFYQLWTENLPQATAPSSDTSIVHQRSDIYSGQYHTIGAYLLGMSAKVVKTGMKVKKNILLSSLHKTAFKSIGPKTDHHFLAQAYTSNMKPIYPKKASQSVFIPGEIPRTAITSSIPNGGSVEVCNFFIYLGMAQEMIIDTEFDWCNGGKSKGLGYGVPNVKEYVADLIK